MAVTSEPSFSKATMCENPKIYLNSVIIMEFFGTSNSEGYFKVLMNFPFDYPKNPPMVKFTFEIWYPKIFIRMDECIISMLLNLNDESPANVKVVAWRKNRNEF
ncbi:hypothetical protein M9H77_22426 [Catharanthus roseus]|uniref:Uncharacterized protein n=1 Tax=Catharanthus roseus TaxID=4058 RepID=A0ACC0AQ57_CATRO|nr:hypothetical protein M9H77_22426 [Catharanthus roseus]